MKCCIRPTLIVTASVVALAWSQVVAAQAFEYQDADARTGVSLEIAVTGGDLRMSGGVVGSGIVQEVWELPPEQGRDSVTPGEASESRWGSI